MRQVIAMKLKGVWVQADLSFEAAEGILGHDKSFEEFVALVDGKLKRFIKPKSDDVNPESLPDNPA